MADYKGFGSVVSAVERMREGFNEAVSTVGNNIEDFRENIDDGLKGVKRNFSKLEWSLKRTSWQLNKVMKAFESPPTSKELAQKEYKENIQNLEGKDQYLANAFRAIIREQTGDLVPAIESIQEESGFNPLGIAQGLFGSVYSALVTPIEATVFGAFEELGASQTRDFGKGMSDQMQKSLGLSFTETGGDFGKILGNEIFNTYSEGLKIADDLIRNNKDFDFADSLGKTLYRAITQTIIQIPSLAFKAHRRIQLNKNAIPQSKIQAGKLIAQNDIPTAVQEDIANNKSITLVVGGQNSDPADIGKDYTTRLLRQYMGGSAVIPVQRQWTNAPIGEDFEEQAKGLFNLILNNDIAKTGLKDYLTQGGLLGGLSQKEQELLTERYDNLDASTIEGLIDTLTTLIKDQDFSMGKLLEATFKGYNPDDVLIASEALKYKALNPEKPLQIVGWSQGGYQAAGAVEILNRMGLTDVKGMGIGTPLTGLNYTGSEENFQSFVGQDDFYYKALSGLLEGFVTFPDNFTVGQSKGEGKGHSLPFYLGKEDTDLKGLMQSFFGLDRTTLPKDSDFTSREGMYLYSVGEFGAETGVLRTLLKALGEDKLNGVDPNEGFTFDAQASLPGYRKNLQDKVKKVKNPEVVEFSQQYDDFLGTLQQDLELVEKLALIGVKYKPVESLQKAVRFFPQLESISSKYESSGVSPETLQTSRQKLAENKPLIDFRQEMLSQRGNMERTIEAMLGRRFSKEDEQKGIYSFYKEDDYENRANQAMGGMISWLENSVLGNADTFQKDQAQPFLDFLNRLKAAMLEVGATGQFNVEVARDAQRFFGVDLRQFEDLFKEAEGKGGVIDVNEQKATLKDLRSRSTGIKKTKSLNIKNAQVFQPINTDRPEQTLSETFQESLTRFVEQAQQQAQETIKTIIPDFDYLPIQTKREALKEYVSPKDANIEGTIKQRMLEFRRAIADGEKQLALELGQSILRQIQSIRKIYDDLSQSPELQDVTSQGSIRSQKGVLTRYQNEVIGNPTPKNQNPYGMIQIGQDAENSGDEALKGFIEGFNAEYFRRLGQEAGENVIEGTRNALDSQSPSREFVKIGKDIVEGLVLGIRDNAIAVSQAVDFLVRYLGENTLAGFVSRLNIDIGQEIGQKFAQGVSEGIAETLKIASPSDVTRYYGEMSAEGFSEGLAEIEANLSSFGEIVGQSFEVPEIELPEIELPEIPEIEEVGGGDAFGGLEESAQEAVESTGNILNDGLNWLADAIDDILNIGGDEPSSFEEWAVTLVDGISGKFEELKEQFPIIERFQQLFSKAGRVALNFMGAIASLQFLGDVTGFGEFTAMLGSIADPSLEAAVNLQNFTRALDGINPGNAVKDIEFLNKTVSRLGTDIEIARGALLGLRATTKYTGLEGSATDRIFSAFSQVAGARGLTSEEQSQMFTAIQQMISKQKVSSEEVRGQLGEIPNLNFQSTLGRVLGVNPAQLEYMLSQGQLMAEDVLPKVAQQYLSDTNNVINQTDTVTQAINRFNNAGTTLKENFQTVFLPLKTNGLKTFTLMLQGMNVTIKASAELLLSYVILLGGKFVAALTGATLAGRGFTVALRALIGFIQTSLLPFAGFMAQLLAIIVVLDVFKNALFDQRQVYKDLQKDLEDMRKGYERLKIAIEEANNAGKNKPNKPEDLPEGDQVNTGRTWNFLGWDTGLNKDGLIRLVNRQRQSIGLNPMFKTQGQIESMQLTEAVGSASLENSRYLGESQPIQSQIKETLKLQEQLNVLRSRRFDFGLANSQQYTESLEQQQILMTQIEEKQKASVEYVSGLDARINKVKADLELLEEKRVSRTISGEDYGISKPILERDLQGLTEEKAVIDSLISSVDINVDDLEFALRNLAEQANYTAESLEREGSLRRARFLQLARGKQFGTDVVGVESELINQDILRQRISNYVDDLTGINKYLEDPKYAQTYQELVNQADAYGVNLYNTATLERILGENRDPVTNSVVRTLQQKLQFETELNQSGEELAQSQFDIIQSARDLEISIADFFFALEQQIKETQVQIENSLNALKTSRLNNQLTNLLVPGTRSLISGTVETLQQFNETAQSVQDQFNEVVSARLALDTEIDNLEQGLDDFKNATHGASEALERLANAVLMNVPGYEPRELSPTIQPTAKNAFSVPGGEITGDQGDQHRGVDVFAPTGTPILSPFSGTLVYALAGEGRNKNEDSNPDKPGFQQQHSIKIKLDVPITFDGKTITHAYLTHLTELAPGLLNTSGGRIEKGQNLGKLGVAGGAPHLHLGLSESESFKGNTPLSNAETIKVLNFLAEKQGQSTTEIVEEIRGIPVKKTSAVPEVNQSFPATFTAPNLPQVTGTKQQALINAANQIGLKPEELAAIISFETAGTFDPNIVGGEGNKYRGLIQFGPWEQQKYGIRQGQGFEEQLNAVVAFFKDRGFKEGMGLLKAYTTVLAGNPNANINSQDVNSTSSYSAFQQQLSPGKPHYLKAQEWLSQGQGQVEVEERPSDEGDELTQSAISAQEELIETQQQSAENALGQLGEDAKSFKGQTQRSVEDAMYELDTSTASLTAQLTDFSSNFGGNSLANQNEAELQSIAQQIASIDRLFLDTIRMLQDTISESITIVTTFPEIIKGLRESSDPADQQRAIVYQTFLEETLESQIIEKSQAKLEKVLQEKEQWKTGTQAETKEFIKRSQEIRKISQDLELINIQLNNAQSENNIEKEKELALIKATKEYELEILEIRQNFPELQEREVRLQEAQNSLLLQRQAIENNYERQRLSRLQAERDIDSRIAESQANLSANPYQGNMIREQNAAKNAELEYQSRILQNNETYAQNPELRDRLNAKEFEAFGLQLQEIDTQYQSLGEAFGGTLTDSINAFVQALANGENAFEAFAKTILSGLSNIASQLIQSSLQGFFQNIFGSLGSGISGGGATSSIFTGFTQLPAFKMGGTIEDEILTFAMGGTIKSDNLSVLDNPIPTFASGGTIVESIQKAFRKEGKGATLIVAHKGEEILSDLTGEAQIYQGLKQRLGENPLSQIKIPTFAYGGSVGTSLLTNLNMESMSLNYRGLGIENNSYTSDRTQNITINVETPDVAGFNRSERQLGRLIKEYGSR